MSSKPLTACIVEALIREYFRIATVVRMIATIILVSTYSLLIELTTAVVNGEAAVVEYDELMLTALRTGRESLAECRTRYLGIMDNPLTVQDEQSLLYEA